MYNPEILDMFSLVIHCRVKTNGNFGQVALLIFEFLMLQARWPPVLWYMPGRLPPGLPWDATSWSTGRGMAVYSLQTAWGACDGCWLSVLYCSELSPATVVDLLWDHDLWNGNVTCYWIFDL